MPFVPRSQIEQQQATAPMSVVENADNRRQNEPVTDNANVEEQINELNELLAHVLDEISSLKSAIYDKARSEKVRNPKKKIRGRRDAGCPDDSDASTSTDEVEEKPARPEKVAADPLPTRSGARNGIDFSGCF